MREDESTAFRTVGLLAVTAGVTLLFRLNQRVQERRRLRKEAFRKLRESGEFFFAPISDHEANASWTEWESIGNA